MDLEWTDVDGDYLNVMLRSDGDVGVLTRRDNTVQSVDLTREEVTELRDALSRHLLDTDPHPHGPTEEQLAAAGVQSSVAVDAHGHVYGARQGDYGHPREDFTRTAVLWTGLLQHKLADGEYITPEDYARCMVAVKLSRDVHSPKRDNRVDVAGYAICLDRLETGR